MAVKGFMLCSGTEILYKPEPVHTLNHNQKLINVFICKMIAFKIEYQQNIYYT